MIEQYVYRCYDAAGRLLYIGCTQYPERRIGEHVKRSPWAERMTQYALEGPYGYYEGFAAEKVAIAAEHPEFNRRGRAVA